MKHKQTKAYTVAVICEDSWLDSCDVVVPIWPLSYYKGLPHEEHTIKVQEEGPLGRSPQAQKHRIRFETDQAAARFRESAEQDQPILQDAETVSCLPLGIHQGIPSGLSELILLHHESTQGQTRKGRKVHEHGSGLPYFA